MEMGRLLNFEENPYSLWTGCNRLENTFKLQTTTTDLMKPNKNHDQL